VQPQGVIVLLTAKLLLVYLSLTCQIEPGATLPSPEMLKGKILLKDKIRLKKLKE